MRKAKAIRLKEEGDALAAMSWLSNDERTKAMYVFQAKLDKDADMFKPKGQALLLQFVSSLDGMTCLINMSARGVTMKIPLGEKEAWSGVINRVFAISGLTGKKAVPPNRAARRKRK